MQVLLLFIGILLSWMAGHTYTVQSCSVPMWPGCSARLHHRYERSHARSITQYWLNWSSLVLGDCHPAQKMEPFPDANYSGKVLRDSSWGWAWTTPSLLSKRNSTGRWNGVTGSCDQPCCDLPKLIRAEAPHCHAPKHESMWTQEWQSVALPVVQSSLSTLVNLATVWAPQSCLAGKWFPLILYLVPFDTFPPTTVPVDSNHEGAPPPPTPYSQCE